MSFTGLSIILPHITFIFPSLGFWFRVCSLWILFFYNFFTIDASIYVFSGRYDESSRVFDIYT